MASWLGQYCINVTDLDAAVAFYEALGLACTSRTEIPRPSRRSSSSPGDGGKLQLAQQKEQDGPLDLGNAFWKLYVDTTRHRRHVRRGAIDAGRDGRVGARAARPLAGHGRRSCATPTATSSSSSSDTRGPTTTPTTRRGSASTASTSPTSSRRSPSTSCSASRAPAAPRSPHAREAILEQPGQGGKLQLAQQHDRDGPHRTWARCGSSTSTPTTGDGLHDAAVDAGHTSVVAPMRLDRWPVTIAFVADPDGYQVELVQRHND